MKTKLLLGAFAILLSTYLSAQVSGNYNYRVNSDQYARTLRTQPANLANLESYDYHTFKIDGLMNIEADSYLAIFTITQLGQSQAEADLLVRAKTDSIKSALIRQGVDVEVYVDMISFLPVYEVEVTKKLFSPDTYNEIPKGFELKKNLHFRYKHAEILDELVTQCAQQEIYDLVRVDYFIDNIEAKKEEMIKKAEAILLQRIARRKRLQGDDFSNLRAQIAEGFKMYYPFEQYETYTAYCSNTFNRVTTSTAQTTQAAKTTSEFYRPLLANHYDFVVNSSILEPVVQMEYEIIIRYSPKPEPPAVPQVRVEKEIEKQLFFVNPEGGIQKLNF